MLNASRFAHYIKVIMRDKIGSFQSSKNVESYLQAWIAEYVLLSDGATQEMIREALLPVYTRLLCSQDSYFTDFKLINIF